MTAEASTETFPQYAKSTDPAVIAAIEANLEAYRDFVRRAMAFAQSVGADSFYPGDSFGTRRIRAVAGEKPTIGRWKNAGREDAWLPFAKSEHEKELNDIEFRRVAIPGLPRSISRPAAGFSSEFATPSPFLHDGAAYVGLPFAHDPSEPLSWPAAEPGEWTEIRGSEYLAAKEEVELARESVKA